MENPGQKLAFLPEAVQRDVRMALEGNVPPGHLLLNLEVARGELEKELKRRRFFFLKVGIGIGVLAGVLFWIGWGALSWIVLAILIAAWLVHEMRVCSPLKRKILEPNEEFILASQYFLILKRGEEYQFFHLQNMKQPKTEPIFRGEELVDILFYFRYNDAPRTLRGMLKFGRNSGRRLQEHLQARLAQLAKQREEENREFL